ncbi:hypothetical protein PanWU01x14_168910 [Parasponia andersonii]|uniref:Uncharacterized protein n=1 Tax=Parasponia andersonii TaxID=3476 RepID=A0A2P5CAS3_PARAD|nr:hypothetical protein PanWU01x14_168910 [Parasponia andersonii]
MMLIAEELENLHINTMFQLEKEKDKNFILNRKLLNFGLNEKYEPGDNDKEQHIDGNMMILSRISKGQSFDDKVQGTSKSSELKVKARFCRVEEDITSVKDEV